MALFTLADATDLTDVAIQKIWLKQTDLEKNTYFDKYFHVEKNVTDRLLKDSSLSGLGQASRIVENAIITSESPVQGFDKTYTQVSYGKLLAVTKEMWKFGIKKRSLERVAQSLRNACMRRREVDCADRLDQSFNTSYTKSDDSGSYSITISGGDSRALIATNHTGENGGTDGSNRVTDGTTVNMDMDYDALKAAHRTASLILDPKGQKMDINLDTIVVSRGSTVAFRVKELLGAIRAGGKQSIPGSADNDAAGVPAYKVVEIPYITTNTAYWWMFDSSMMGPEFGLQYKESQPIQLEGPNQVFKTDEIQYKATMLYDLGFNEWRNWVGSKNTNAA